jgi:NAD(P)-dependent dehydrogenase (short-subunit alcohol dehydrogenase family)
VVVCNAGVGTFAAIEEHDLLDARATFDTNFWGSLHVMRAALPTMRRQGRGVIVSISSMAGRVPPGRSLGFYGASKHAIGAIADTLGAEVEPFGIRVVTIEPGMVATAITDNAPILIPPGSPYGDLVREAAVAVDGFVRAGAPAASVADAIVAAVDDPDAETIVALFAEVGYEGWGAAMGARTEARRAGGSASLPSPP